MPLMTEPTKRAFAAAYGELLVETITRLLIIERENADSLSIDDDSIKFNLPIERREGALYITTQEEKVSWFNRFAAYFKTKTGKKYEDGGSFDNGHLLAQSTGIVRFSVDSFGAHGKLPEFWLNLEAVDVSPSDFIRNIEELVETMFPIIERSKNPTR